MLLFAVLHSDYVVLHSDAPFVCAVDVRRGVGYQLTRTGVVLCSAAKYRAAARVSKVYVFPFAITTYFALFILFLPFISAAPIASLMGTLLHSTVPLSTPYFIYF